MGTWSKITGRAAELRAASDRAPVLIYALGGGAGHVVRGASLAAALARAGVEAAVFAPARARELARALAGSARVIPCPRPPGPSDSPDARARLRARLDAALLQTRARHLVVDSFPAGVLGELADPRAGDRLAGLRVTALLRLHRGAARPEFRAALARCDAALDLEPHLDWLPEHAHHDITRFGPVCRPLARAPAERDVLLLPGEPALLDFYRRLTSRLRARGLEVARVDPAPTPVALAALDARVIVGAAGFNLSYETIALGRWHLCLPRPRRHDDQRRRARALAIIPERPEAMERLALRLARSSARRRSPIRVRAPDELAAALLNLPSIRPRDSSRDPGGRALQR